MRPQESEINICWVRRWNGEVPDDADESTACSTPSTILVDTTSWYYLFWDNIGMMLCKQHRVTYLVAGSFLTTQKVTNPNEMSRFLTFWNSERSGVENKHIFFVRNPDINFHGKCQNDSKSGFLTNVMIRENVTSFCHDSWHFLCSLGTAL